MGKIFNPERYGMVFCPDCKGKAKLPENPDGFIVCSRCGVAGLLKKKRKLLKRIDNLVGSGRGGHPLPTERLVPTR